ncbi:hypothetical protein DFH07DRAFT_782139 [Mycena maculata]|uniref:Uncharacterized protein n=1 Tax=Mycena maculata TaxID=230809 RepID=A0AAD7HUI5_9AGAR|nr:hypothetical protein DFH07DRAFT_782139 [Mycena maculata]
MNFGGHWSHPVNIRSKWYSIALQRYSDDSSKASPRSPASSTNDAGAPFVHAARCSVDDRPASLLRLPAWDARRWGLRSRWHRTGEWAGCARGGTEETCFGCWVWEGAPRPCTRNPLSLRISCCVPVLDVAPLLVEDVVVHVAASTSESGTTEHAEGSHFLLGPCVRHHMHSAIWGWERPSVSTGTSSCRYPRRRGLSPSPFMYPGALHASRDGSGTTDMRHVGGVTESVFHVSSPAVVGAGAGVQGALQRPYSVRAHAVHKRCSRAQTLWGCHVNVEWDRRRRYKHPVSGGTSSRGTAPVSSTAWYERPRQRIHPPLPFVPRPQWSPHLLPHVRPVEESLEVGRWSQRHDEQPVRIAGWG